MYIFDISDYNIYIIKNKDKEKKEKKMNKGFWKVYYWIMSWMWVNGNIRIWSFMESWRREDNIDEDVDWSKIGFEK